MTAPTQREVLHHRFEAPDCEWCRTVRESPDFREPERVDQESFIAGARVVYAALTRREPLDLADLWAAIENAHLRVYSELGAITAPDAARRIAAEYARLEAER